MLMNMNRNTVMNPVDVFFNDPWMQWPVWTENSRNLTMKVDIREDAEAYTLYAEMPGVRQADIDLHVDEDTLVLAADLNVQNKEEKEQMVHQERRSGHMERRFTLEGIDQTGIHARYQDGILTVTLPKVKAEPKVARKIAIEGNTAASQPAIEGNTQEA